MDRARRDGHPRARGALRGLRCGIAGGWVADGLLAGVLFSVFCISSGTGRGISPVLGCGAAPSYPHGMRTGVRGAPCDWGWAGARGPLYLIPRNRAGRGSEPHWGGVSFTFTLQWAGTLSARGVGWGPFAPPALGWGVGRHGMAWDRVLLLLSAEHPGWVGVPLPPFPRGASGPR